MNYEVPYVSPQSTEHLKRFKMFVRDGRPFTFVRFSDGEVEVLRNRKLLIASGITEFRGRRFSNQFPDFDQKRFDPRTGKVVRSDLLASAIYRDQDYFKGIPTTSNHAIHDREYLLRLHGGFTIEMTFSDLFLNSNFITARSDFFPYILDHFEHLLVVGNWRSNLKGLLIEGRLLPIPDDFFSDYSETLNSTFSELIQSPICSLVLSSASSLSNILGHKLRLSRPDITFLDIGTVLNDMLGLPLGTRAYHRLTNPQTVREKLAAWRYRRHREYQLRW